MVHSRLQDLLDIRTPIVNAPMGGVAGGRLAAAVSAAGGMGMIGMGSAGAPELLRRELSVVPSGTRVGIGAVDWVVQRDPALLDLALSSSPALLSVSFGEDLGWVERAHDQGILAAVQVFDEASAEAAHRAGADILVARGLEGGGHGKPLQQRDALLSTVLSLTDRPVLAAGAIGSRADVDHVLGAGAAGVWVGTAFAATTESLSKPSERRALLSARGADTVLTSAFDRAAGHGWPEDIPERVIANAFTARWDGPDTAFDASRAEGELAEAIARDDPNGFPINAGLGVDSLTRECTAAEVVEALTAG